MKEIDGNLVQIKNKIKSKGKALLMLDFDGTISPFMPTPEQAYLPKKTRSLLKKINKFYPVIIISGRPLDVLKSKIGVKNFIYAGSHGLEWSIGKEMKLKHIPKDILVALSNIENKLNILTQKYPKLLIEKKSYSIAFHYQFIDQNQIKDFKKDLNIFLKPIYKSTHLKIFWDNKTIDIVPQIDWGKGHIAKLIHKYFQDKNKKFSLPIYIGDAKTDEDAFLALKKDGITIRVGKSSKSAAKYYLKNQKEVDKFLEWVINNK